MRQQLFGQQRQREAEARLIHVLGQVHAHLTQAMGGKGEAATRVKALTAVVAGTNQLIDWHYEELLSGRTAGRWVQVLPDTPREILAEVRARYSLFEGATVTGRAIDCDDVIQGIGHLCGPDGDAFFNDALAGTAAMMRAAFERIATDAPTAPAAAALADTWEALLADVEAFAVPVLGAPAAADAPAVSEAGSEEVLLPLARVDADPALYEPDEAFEAPKAETSSPTKAPPTEEALAVASPESPDVTPAGAAPTEERPWLPGSIDDHVPLAAVTDITPILAARFSRIFLVAC